MNKKERAEIVACLVLATTVIMSVLMIKVQPEVLSWFGWIFGTIGAFRTCLVIWRFVCNIAKPDKVQTRK